MPFPDKIITLKKSFITLTLGLNPVERANLKLIVGCPTRICHIVKLTTGQVQVTSQIK